MKGTFNVGCYGIWTVDITGTGGWLIINKVIFWAPDFEIAKAQLHYMEIYGDPDCKYSIRRFTPLL